MSIMAFSQMRGDLSNIGEDFAIAREKYTSHGAQRVSASVALTGASAGSLTLTTIWDSADACFSARAAVTSDPDVQAMLARNQSEPIGFMLGQITGEIGTCEGSMGVGVLATATDNSQEAIDAVLEVQDRIIVSPGNNGMRQVRMIAAGEMTGVYANICLHRVRRRVLQRFGSRMARLRICCAKSKNWCADNRPVCLSNRLAVSGANTLRRWVALRGGLSKLLLGTQATDRRES